MLIETLPVVIERGLRQLEHEDGAGAQQRALIAAVEASGRRLRWSVLAAAGLLSAVLLPVGAPPAATGGALLLAVFAAWRALRNPAG
jgi:methyl coenzyme M reductase beta subunit